MNRKWVRAGVVVAAAGLAAAGVLAASSDSDTPETGPGADAATTAALQATGGGQARAVERDGEDGAVWEVEVKRLDGSVVDVRLDGGYRVVVIEGDTESD